MARAAAVARPVPAPLLMVGMAVTTRPDKARAAAAALPQAAPEAPGARPPQAATADWVVMAATLSVATAETAATATQP
ncbi:hypothetical protein ABIF78_011242 [Bradyrhizobium japonicum]